MTLELDIAPVYENMLEEIDEQVEGDPHDDLEQIVEQAIHESYQQVSHGSN